MPRTYDQFMLFGDSTIQFASYHHDGFSLQAALQEAYIRRLDVVNRGFGGYNTTDALKILPEIIPEIGHTQIQFLVVAFGSNDATLPGYPHHNPLHQYRANLITILTHASLRMSTATSPKIILVTPAPVCEVQALVTDRKRGFPGLRRTAGNTALYVQVVREVGIELGIPVIDLWKLVEEDAGGIKIIGDESSTSSERLTAYFTDGVHYKKRTYELMFNELMKTIRGCWPTQAPERLDWVFPKWDQLYPENQADGSE